MQFVPLVRPAIDVPAQKARAQKDDPQQGADAKVKAFVIESRHRLAILVRGLEPADSKLARRDERQFARTGFLHRPLPVTRRIVRARRHSILLARSILERENLALKLDALLR